MSEETPVDAEVVPGTDLAVADVPAPPALLGAPLPNAAEMGVMLGIAKTMAQSRLIDRVQNQDQALAKMLIARELGISPIKGLTDINIIDGKPALSANLYASFVDSRPGYDYEVLEDSDERCTIQFYKDGSPRGEPVTYSMDDARKAGLAEKTNWKKDPSSMLFARCMSRGVKRRIPGVTGGMALYVEGEIEDAQDRPEQVGPSERRTERLERRAEGAQPPAEGAGSAQPAGTPSDVPAEAPAPEWEPAVGELVRHQDYPDKGPWPVVAIGTDGTGAVAAQLQVTPTETRVVPVVRLMPEPQGDIPWEGEPLDGELMPEPGAQSEADRIAEEAFAATEPSASDFAPVTTPTDVEALKTQARELLLAAGDSENVVNARLRGARDNADMLKGLIDYAEKKLGGSK